MMRELPVRFRREAASDLRTIYGFIVENGGSPNVALGFVTRISARCEKIGLVPDGGALRPRLGPGLRIVPFERTGLIVYRVHDDAVEIVNIFYGGRDYEALMKE